MESPLISSVPAETLPVTRRILLHRVLATSGLAGMAGVSYGLASAQETPLGDKQASRPTNLALALARLLNRPGFGDLSPTAIKHGKMIIASTLASAAPGSLIGSARIVRDLAKEHGGRPEATLWFDGMKLPVSEVA